MIVEESFYFDIPKRKAEYPAIIILGIITFIISAVHYGFFGIRGATIAAGILLGIIIGIVLYRRGKYFVEADDEGIRWRQNIFSKYNNIPWKYLQRVDYLEFEINFMLKETGQVVSFASSGLTDEKTEELKNVISNIIKRRKELKEN